MARGAHSPCRTPGRRASRRKKNRGSGSRPSPVKRASSTLSTARGLRSPPHGDSAFRKQVADRSHSPGAGLSLPRDSAAGVFHGKPGVAIVSEWRYPCCRAAAGHRAPDRSRCATSASTGHRAFTAAARLNRREIDIAGDAQTMPAAAETLAAALGRPIRFVPVPIAEVRKNSEDFADMLEWFVRVGYDSDIPALEARNSASGRRRSRRGPPNTHGRADEGALRQRRMRSSRFSPDDAPWPASAPQSAAPRARDRNRQRRPRRRRRALRARRS